jgi:hypothetical protein
MKLIATSLTIGYEDGSKLVVEGARANKLIEWWFNIRRQECATTVV